MRILVCNDDGIHADGIKALAHEMKNLGETIVMAPDRNQSGASQALTLSHPVRIRELDKAFYSVEGTPADCVHMALTGFLPHPVDIVVSGINHGSNLGDDVLYSGTVAAAIEGCNMGLKSIAFSMIGRHSKHFKTGARIAKILVAKLIKTQLPAKTLLNVNIPDLPFDEIRGFQVTRLGTRRRADPLIQSADPRGLPLYWIGASGEEEDGGPGTDFYAIKQGYVSITPINLDLTHYKVFEQVGRWFEMHSDVVLDN